MTHKNKKMLQRQNRKSAKKKKFLNMSGFQIVWLQKVEITEKKRGAKRPLMHAAGSIFVSEENN